MQAITESWKAIVAFLALIAAQVVAQVMPNESGQLGDPLPTDLRGWLIFAGTAVVGAAAVYLKGQAPNTKQVATHPVALDRALAEQGYRRVPLDAELPPVDLP